MSWPEDLIGVILSIVFGGIIGLERELSGKVAGIQIIPSHGLTRDEVRRLEKEALEHARADMSAHHLIDVRTTLEFDINKAERMIERFGHLIETEQREALVEGIARIRQFARESEDPAAINEKREAFNRMTIPLAEAAMTATLQLDNPAPSKGETGTTAPEDAPSSTTKS